MTVRYHKNEHDYRDYDPLEFLALLSSHIPARWEQTIRFYGEYSARTRGKRRAEQQRTQAAATLTLGEPEDKPEDKPAPSRNWASLIKRVYEVDPLVCARCGSPMRIVAFITDHAEALRLCRNQGIPDYRAPPPLTTPSQLRAAAAELTYEPMPDVP